MSGYYTVGTPYVKIRYEMLNLNSFVGSAGVSSGYRIIWNYIFTLCLTARTFKYVGRKKIQRS